MVSMTVAMARTHLRHFTSFHLPPCMTSYYVKTKLVRLRLLHFCPVLSAKHAGCSTQTQYASAIGCETLEKERKDKVRVLIEKLKSLGVICDDSCIPGTHARLLCPKCLGGNQAERTLSVHIIQDGNYAMWRCFTATCGWAGVGFPGSKPTIEGTNRIVKLESLKEKKSEGTTLEPLSDKLLAYFSERMISEETLRRNHVLQRDQDVIAFTYRLNGIQVGCKYRTLGKRFWQDKGTERFLYGLDDIAEAKEVIIVEGEIDKLSMEEAGYRHCISVPAGAPNASLSKTIPPEEQLGQSI